MYTISIENFSLKLRENSYRQSGSLMIIGELTITLWGILLIRSLWSLLKEYDFHGLSKFFFVKPDQCVSYKPQRSLFEVTVGNLLELPIAYDLDFLVQLLIDQVGVFRVWNCYH